LRTVRTEAGENDLFFKGGGVGTTSVFGGHGWGNAKEVGDGLTLNGGKPGVGRSNPPENKKGRGGKELKKEPLGGQGRPAKR